MTFSDAVFLGALRVKISPQLSIYLGHIKWKVPTSMRKCADSYHPAHAQSFFLAFALHACSIHWFCQLTEKTLIRLCRCAGWSGPLLPACAQRHIFQWHCPQTCDDPFFLTDKTHFTYQFIFFLYSGTEIWGIQHRNQTDDNKDKDTWSCLLLDMVDL